MKKIDGWLNEFKKMFEKIDGWPGKKLKDGWRDIEIDGWMDSNNRQMVGWTGKKIEIWLDGYKNGWMDGYKKQMDGWLEIQHKYEKNIWIFLWTGKIEGQLDGYKKWMDRYKTWMVGWMDKTNRWMVRRETKI